jgi:hypothetical protein
MNQMIEFLTAIPLDRRYKWLGVFSGINPGQCWEGNFKSELADRGPHTVHDGIIFTRISRIQNEFVNGPVLDNRLEQKRRLHPDPFQISVVNTRIEKCSGFHR